MEPAYDCIVIGTGGAGAAALFHLAKKGARVLGLDRFPIAHDRGSSHGETRVIRLSYFEAPEYVPLLLRAYELWAELCARTGQRLYTETGLIQVGHADGAFIQRILESAVKRGLEIEAIRGRELTDRFPGFVAHDSMTSLYERRAGYLLVEACVQAHASEAMKLGAKIEIAPVQSWRAEGGGVAVETAGRTFRAARLIITPGAWAKDLLPDLGVKFSILRKPLFWYRADGDAYSADHGCPVFLFDSPEGIFYGIPKIDAFGLKIAEHSGGEAVEDPLLVDRRIRDSEQARVERFLGEHLPGVSRELTHQVVCMYELSDDEHFVVDRHPAHPEVLFAAGLSGHGFKLTSLLGEALAELALDGTTRHPIDFLSLDRTKRPTAVERR